MEPKIKEFTIPRKQYGAYKAKGCYCPPIMSIRRGMVIVDAEHPATALLRQWVRASPYSGHGTRKCLKCGGLQDN